MKKTGIQRALNELIDERRGVAPERPTLGERVGDADAYSVDVGRIRVLTGLNILAESLITALAERSYFGPCDVHVEQPVNPDLQPELHAAGAANVSFYARLSVLEDLPRFQAEVGYQIRYMFNAIQSDELFSELFPPPGQAPKGILFPFHREDGSDATGFFYLLEHVPCGRFLRITLESEVDSRLRMTRIPHRTVNRIDLVHTRVDIPDAASVVAQGIMEACARQSWKYAATPAHLEDYFRFLRMAGLAQIEALSFSWPASFARETLSAPRSRILASVARMLFALGDSALVSRLLDGSAVRLVEGTRVCHLDLSQKNRCLSLSFDAPRAKAGLPECLARMPAVLRTSRADPEAYPNVRVLLIHHLTGEVLGFIQALADMGAPFVETLWVKYAGAVEPAFREIILSLPETLFRFRGLTPVPEPDGVRSRFLLSGEYSSTADLAALETLLRETPHAFFEAMRRTAGHLFLGMALECRRRNERFAVVEDGGYIAPVVHRLCLEGRTVAEAAAGFGFPEAALPEDSRAQLLREWLRPTFIGSVEHTRNGYEALKAVDREFGMLAFPSLTIAISDFKVNGESRDVAYSCLHAVESILNGMGFALADRVALVLGAQGAIGRKTMKILGDRLGAGHLYGVDVVPPAVLPAWTFASAPESLPEAALAGVDFVFGVVGQSICRPEWIERLLRSTRREHLFFASGSTKTAEFAHLSDWLSALATQPSPTVAGEPATVAISDIFDPKTGARQGRSARLSFGGKTVTLHLLADLMPVNFLYYGVPSETMNHVMNELLRLGALLARRHAAGDPFPPALLALDHEIGIDGRPVVVSTKGKP